MPDASVPMSALINSYQVVCPLGQTTWYETEYKDSKGFAICYTEPISKHFSLFLSLVMEDFKFLFVLVYVFLILYYWHVCQMETLFLWFAFRCYQRQIILMQLSNELEQTQKRQRRSTPIEWMTLQCVSGGVI